MTTFRVVLATIVTLVVLVVLWSWLLLRPGPPIRLSKQTTYITEPLAADGLPDYLAYLEEKYGEGVTPENNAVVPLVRATGLHSVSGVDRDEWFARLGMENLPEGGEYLTSLEDAPAVNETANWLVGFWRSQQRGGEPPHSVDGLTEYTDAIAELDENIADPFLMSGTSAYGSGLAWADATQQAAQRLNERAGQRPWTSSQLPPAAAWLEANDELIDLGVAASERPKMYAPLVTGIDGGSPNLYAVLLPTVQDSRTVCRGLQTRVMRNLGERRFAEARRDTSATHRLARLTGDGPFLIHLLVGLAFDGMACEQQIALSSQPDVPVEVLQDALDELRGLKRWRRGADQTDQVERLAALDAALSLQRNRGNTENWAIEDSNFLSQAVRLNIDWNIVLERMNGYYDEEVAAMRLPDQQERERAFAAINAKLQEPRRELATRLAGAALSRSSRSEFVADVLAALVIPATGTATTAEVRTNTQIDLATTAMALALFRAQHGAYPDTLDALVPAILDEVPRDEFEVTGDIPVDASFHYERRGDGYLLYSVGQNHVDNGGTNQSRDIIAGDWASDTTAANGQNGNTAEGDDLVVRVPMPALVIPSLPDDVELPSPSNNKDSSKSDNSSESDDSSDVQAAGATTQE